MISSTRCLDSAAKYNQVCCGNIVLMPVAACSRDRGRLDGYVNEKSGRGGGRIHIEQPLTAIPKREGQATISCGKSEVSLSTSPYSIPAFRMKARPVGPPAPPPPPPQISHARERRRNFFSESPRNRLIERSRFLRRTKKSNFPGGFIPANGFFFFFFFFHGDRLKKTKKKKGGKNQNRPS